MARLTAWCLLSLGLSPVFAAQIPFNTYAQELVNEVARKNPSLSGVSIIAAPPKSSQSLVLASTDHAKVGAAAEEVDLAAAKSGNTSTAVNASGDRVDVSLALRDVGSANIGALHLSYPYPAGVDSASLERNADAIRDALHRRISHSGNLLDPYPYEQDAPANTYAQQLVNEFILKYPQIEIFAIHATPPDSDYNIIAGSNIGRVGKKADNDDMRCVYTGKPNLEVNSTGTRFESEMQLHDRAGGVIGAVGIVVGYQAGDDKQALHAHAEQIRAELEKRIPDAASLFQQAY